MHKLATPIKGLLYIKSKKSKEESKNMIKLRHYYSEIDNIHF